MGFRRTEPGGEGLESAYTLSLGSGSRLGCALSGDLGLNDTISKGSSREELERLWHLSWSHEDKGVSIAQANASYVFTRQATTATEKLENIPGADAIPSAYTEKELDEAGLACGQGSGGSVLRSRSLGLLWRCGGANENGLVIAFFLGGVP